MRFGTILVAVALAGSACSGSDDGPSAFGDELEFGAEQAFLPGLDVDTGWLPAGSPAAVRATVSAGGGLTLGARATTDGETMEPVAGSGTLTVEGALTMEVSVRIDASGVEYEGVVESFEYAIDSVTTEFDPFVVDQAVRVSSALPAQELGSVPIGGVPGASRVVAVAGGELVTEFTGLCADTAAGHGQYTGQTTTTGTVGCEATIVIEIPIVGTETFGPFAFDVPVPALTRPVDLGTRSLTTGEAATGMDICATGPGTGSGDGAADADDGAGASGTTTTAVDGGSEDSGATDNGSEDTGATDGGATDGGATDTGPEPLSDPDYPRPEGALCPGETISVTVEGPSNGVCLPPCEMDGTCPSGTTGNAFGACGFSPDSSYLSCLDDTQCGRGETCEARTCLAESTHCVLYCDMGETCPDGMDCLFSVCVYLE